MRSLIPRRRSGDDWMTEAGSNPLSRLRDEMATMFDRFFGRGEVGDWGGDRLWGASMEEKEKELIIHAEAPGFDGKDFEIDINGNTMTIRAEHREGGPTEGQAQEMGAREGETKQGEKSEAGAQGAQASQTQGTQTQEGQAEEQPTFWGYRRFERTFTLPSEVEADKAEAQYRNGILEIHLPRTQQPPARRVQVKT